MNGMIFSKILSMSIIGCYSILIVFLIRFFLKKIRRKYSYYLWMIVFLNLSVPFSILGPFSLIPEKVAELSADHTVMESAQEAENAKNAELEFRVYTEYGELARAETVGAMTASEKESEPEHQNGLHSVNRQDILRVAEKVWLAGICIFGIYAICSALRFRYYLKKSRQEKEGSVVKVKNLATPFLFGIVHPTIYLPSDIEEEEQEYILAHEQCHRKRKDYLIKLWIYAVTIVHWFNPFAWLAYSFCCKDMEISCDEEVLEHAGEEIKKAYAKSLLKYAAKQNGYVLTPLTFGEPSVRSRIQNVLEYRRKKPLVLTVGIVLTCAAAAGLFFRPAGKPMEQEKNVPVMEEPEAFAVSGNGSCVIQIGNRICYMFGKPLYSDGTFLYAAQGEGEKAVICRYGFGNDYFRQMLGGVPVGAAEDGTALYYNTKDGNQLFLHRFDLQEETTEENILGEAIIADQMTAFFESGDYLVFAAGSYEGSANLYNGDFYAYHQGRRELSQVHLTDADQFFVLGDRIYYQKYSHEGSEPGGLYSANFLFGDEKKISEGLEILQTDEQKNELLVSKEGKLYNLTPDGKDQTELFDLADAGWTWEEGEHLYFREASVLGNVIYVKAEKWSYVGDHGWRESLTKSQYFQIPSDGSGYTEWDPNDSLEKYYADFEFFDETLPGQPLKNPEENGWKLQAAIDVSGDFRRLPYEPKEEDKEQTYLIGRTKKYTLYGSGDYEEMLLEHDGKYAEIHYPYMSNYMEEPQLWETDADGDGKTELALTLHLQHGSGLSIESFFMADVWSNEGLYVYQFLTDDICAQLSEHLTYEITEEGCQAFVDGNKAGPIEKNVEDIEPFYGASIGDQIHFYEEEGRIEVSADIGFRTESNPYMPWYNNYCDVTAAVSLENGKFLLSDFCSKNRGLESSIRYKLQEQYGRDDLIVTHITYDSPDMNRETLSATARVQLPENEYYDEVKISLRRDENAYRSGWEIEKIH